MEELEKVHNRRFDNEHCFDVDLKIKIVWIKPSSSTEEEIFRNSSQALLDEKADRFAKEIRMKLETQEL